MSNFPIFWVESERFFYKITSLFDLVNVYLNHYNTHSNKFFTIRRCYDAYYTKFSAIYGNGETLEKFLSDTTPEFSTFYGIFQDLLDVVDPAGVISIYEEPQPFLNGESIKSLMLKSDFATLNDTLSSVVYMLKSGQPA